METIPGAPFWLALLGLCLGSFLNVVVHRAPHGRSLIRPRSHCPRCKTPIAIRDNIPLLGFLLLRGRCRHCRAPIGLRYPLLELLGAAGVLAAALTSATAAAAAFKSLFLLTMMAVTVIDLEHRVIPDEITLPGVVFGLLACPWLGVARLDAGIGVLAGAGGLLLVAVVYRAARKIEGLGMGDVKLAGMLGAWLGWQGMIMTLVVGSVAGSLVGAGLLASGRGTRTTALPYGAFLAPAAILAALFGAPLWNWYLNLNG